MKEDGMMRKRKISLDDDEESSNSRSSPTSFRKNANTRYEIRKLKKPFLPKKEDSDFIFLNSKSNQREREREREESLNERRRNDEKTKDFIG